jgi:hypothetical protein
MTPDERRTREKILRLEALIDGISRALEHVSRNSHALHFMDVKNSYFRFILPDKMTEK